MGHLLTSEFHLSASQIMLMGVTLNISVVLIFPIMGLIADKKIGKERLMILSSLIAIVTPYPLFLMLQQNLSLSNIIFIQAILGIITAGFVAPSMALLSSFFPVHERYSGIGFGYALGGALLGGTTPLILASLTSWLDSPLVPAYYLMFSGCMGILCVVGGRKEAQYVPEQDHLRDDCPTKLKVA